MDRFYDEDKIAENYLKFRPKYTEEVAEAVMKYLDAHYKEHSQRKHDLMVDVGCGSGQGTNLFATHFKKIVGVDICGKQIQCANKQNTHENISYLVGKAEELPFEDHSVDLVACGTAAHWFNLPKFFQEVLRVLKPSGCLAVFAYGFTEIYPTGMKNEDKARATTNIFTELLHTGLTGHRLQEWVREKPAFGKAEVKIYDDVFNAIPFPNKQRNDDISMILTWSLDDFLGFVSSSVMTRALEKGKEELKNFFSDVLDKDEDNFDLFDIVSRKVKKIWNLEDQDQVELKAEMDIYLLLSVVDKA
ncbi:unnamed protein product [Clavelina lepadiformis]|uniref:Methyltransferase type 11 domain-containing protein n=1 Tax=Clavelina lepadiformis TaxID=159417 RepID=A0ABP0GMC8_CLALP